MLTGQREKPEEEAEKGQKGGKKWGQEKLGGCSEVR